MKYIDADKLKAEIERRRKIIEGLFTTGDNSFYDGWDDAYGTLLDFIDSLPDENNPEPYNPVYDEDYLNEKIAKATKSWEGVNVDKYMAEMRGYEQPSKSLEEAARQYAEGPECTWAGTTALEYAFIAGAKWQKEQMLKDAEPAEIGYFNQRGLSILTEKAIERMPVSEGDKVRIIILKAEED